MAKEYFPEGQDEYLATFRVSYRRESWSAKETAKVFLGMYGEGHRPLNPSEARELAALIVRAAELAEKDR